MTDARCPVVIGRDAEITVLGTALAEARQGRGGVVVLAGAPGVGKSRLLNEVVGTARAAGCTVAKGRALAVSAGVPYRPLSEALLQVLRGFDPAGLAVLGPWRAGLRSVLPDPGVQPPVVAASPLVCGEAVLRLLRAVSATAPLLLGLEDLHWADPDTLGVLEYLADNLDETAALCVVTVRSEPPCAATRLVHTLSVRRNIGLLTLAPLPDMDARDMVLACRPWASAATVESVVAAAEGSPFLVEELLAAPGLPPSFVTSVQARLAELDPAARAVIVAAAVLGRQVDWWLLSAACGQDDDTISAALAAARDRLLVDVEGDRFRFRHALTREAVLDGLLPPERQRMARVCLAAIEAADPDLPGDRRALAAELAQQAGLPARTAALLLAWGSDVLRRGALATAIDTLARARACATDEPARRAAQAQLVEALAQAGRTDECLTAGAELLGAIPAGDVAARLHAHLSLAHAAVEATRWPSVAVHLAASESLLRTSHDLKARGRWQVLAAEAALARRDLAESHRLAQQALASSGTTAEVRCHAFGLLGRSSRALDLDAASAAFEEALAVAEMGDLPLARLRALHELGTIELFDHAGTERLRQARVQAEELGALSTAAVLDVQLAAAHLFRFEPDGVAAHAGAALALAERLRLQQLRATATVFLAEGEGLRGDQDAMERHNLAALAAAPDDDEIAGSVWGGRAVASLLVDDRALARHALDRAHTLLAALPNSGPGIYLGLRPLLLAVDANPAAQAATETAATSGMTVNRANRGLLCWAEAVLAGRAGSSASADELAERGIANLAAYPVWSDLARMLGAEAARVDGWGQPRPWLSACAATFADRGITALARRCQAAAGTEPEPQAAFGITPQDPPTMAALTHRTREATMGTGQQQAQLWGPGARDWSDYNEPMCTPFYEAVLDATHVGPGTALLDVGCGGGFALLLAAQRGATVTGIDATEPLLDIARERVPNAALHVGDIDDPLPFDDAGFDVVTSFNAVQFAADPVRVIKHMAGVSRPGGLVSILVWGPPDQCESGTIFAELGPLLPPAPPAAPGSIAWSEDGQLEQLARRAGLTPLEVTDVSNPLIYPDLATAVRTQLSSGPARRAIQAAGLPATRGALTRAFAASRCSDGTYRQDNLFRYLVARV